MHLSVAFFILYQGLCECMLPHIGIGMLQGWNKQWDEWVEQTGLHKYKKELLDVKFEETSAQETGDAK